MVLIQIIAVIVSIFFLFSIAGLIKRGKLREEYAIVWVICTAFLVIFSFWRKGFEIISQWLGVFDPPNLIFTGAIFACMIYLLHLSIVVSRLQQQNKALAQEIALLKEKEKEKNQSEK
jgi:hypothetical protein